MIVALFGEYCTSAQTRANVVGSLEMHILHIVMDFIIFHTKPSYRSVRLNSKVSNLAVIGNNAAKLKAPAGFQLR